MPKSKALGRGLEVLIPTFQTGDREAQDSPVKEISIHDIKPNPYQPRRKFAPEELKELAQSISERGLISPITVTEKGNDYILVAGERRLRACKQLGFKTIPTYFRTVDTDEELMELALIENVQRENLNPIEEAMAYRALIERYGLSQETVSERIGKKRSTIANSLRLLKLPQEIRESLIQNEISSGHARAILAAENSPAMIRIWQQVVNRGLSVREAEKLTRKSSDEGSMSAKSVLPVKKDPAVLKLESSLQQSLGTKVRIKHRKPGGTIEVTYYSAEDLERILDIVESGTHENR